MRKSWIGFGIVSGVAVAVAVVPYFIDWNWYKPELVAAVEAATGLEVEVAGDIGFALLPSPRLSAEGLTVTGYGASKAPLIKAKKLAAAVAFWPLLSKKAEVKYIALEEPTLRLVSYADGTNNWSDPKAKQDEATTGELSIEDFRVENGTFIKTGTDGTSTEINDVNLRVEVASAEGPYMLKGDLRYGAIPLSINASYKAGGELKFEADVEEAGHFDFVGQVGESEGGVPTPISGHLAVRGDSLGALMAAISDDDEGKRTPAFEKPVKISAVVRGNSERINISEIRGSVAGSDLGGEFSIISGDRMRVEGRAALARLDLADWSDESSDKDGDPFELPADIDAAILLRIIELSNGQMQLGTVNAPLKLERGALAVSQAQIALAGGARAVVSGTLDAASGKPRFRGRFSTSLPRTATTLRALGYDDYKLLPPVALSGALGYADDVVTASGLRGNFDGKPVAGSLRFPLKEGAAIDVALVAQSINLDRLVATDAARNGKDAGEARPVRFNVKLGQVLSEGSVYRGISAIGVYADDSVKLTQAVVRDALGFGVTAKGTIDRWSDDRRADLAVGLAGETVKGAITVTGPMSKLDIGGAVVYAGAKLALDGWVRTEPDTAYELDVSATAPEAGAVLARLQDEARGGKLGPLDLRLQIAGAGDNARITKLDGQVGSMTLSGSAAINTAGAVPTVNAVLKAGVVPVTALLGDDGTGAAEAASGAGARWSSEPLSFDWIRRFNGRIAVTADKAIYDTYVLDRPQLALVSRGGTLAIEGMNAGMYGGKLAVTGALRSGGDQGLAIKMALSDVPLEPLLKAASASAPATGTFDFSGNFSARGRSQKALMSSLSGPVRLSASNGVIRKVDLKRLDEQLGDLRSANSLIQFANTALKGGETPYSSLAAELQGSEGRFTIGRVVTDMDGGSASAKGYVDIGAYYADVTALLTLGSHDDAPSIPASIKGPLPTPTVKYSLGPLQAWFAKRIALVGLKAAVKGEGLDIGGLLGVRKAAPADGTGSVAETSSEQGASAAKPTVDEELGVVVNEGLSKLFKKKKTPAAEPAPATTEERPLAPANLDDN